MSSIVILFGLAVATMGVLMMIQPRLILDTMYSFTDEKWLQVFSAALRVILGSALLACAEQTRFTLSLQIIGLLTLISGVGLAVISHLVFHRVIKKSLHYFRLYARFISLLIIGFGMFLVYAMMI